MKTISIPTNRRPEYLSRCLESIQSAVGYQDWTLLFSSEPHTPPIGPPPNMECYSSCNFHQLGCRGNTFLTTLLAHTLGSEFNLYLEEDVILSPDALLMADAFRVSGLPGMLCLRRWYESQTPEHGVCRPAEHGLLGNGFAYPSSLWPTLAKYWFFDQPQCGGKMWDWSVALGMHQEGVPQWRPMVNRSQNIGLFGTHGAGIADPNHHSPCYQGPPITKFEFRND